MKTLNSMRSRGMAVSIAGISVLAIAAILLLSTPFFSFAAGTTVTVSTDKASYPATVGTQITVSGTVSPIPSSGSSATIQIKDASGTVLYLTSASVSTTTGAFSTVVTSGFSSSWKNGTYTVDAVWAPSSTGTTYTGSTTFQYGTVATTTTTTTTPTTTTTTTKAYTTIINNTYTLSTTISQITTVSAITTVNQAGTTVVTTISQAGTTVQQAGTTVNNTTSVPSGPNGTDEALAGVAIVIAIIAIALAFIRRK